LRPSNNSIKARQYSPTSPVHRDDSNRRSIWFTAPWIRLGGVDQIILNLARQLAESDTGYDVHLLVTDASEIDADPRSIDPFKTVTFLASGENRDEQQLIDILAGADIIFNAHSRATYNALPRLRGSVSAPIVSLLQVIDPDRFGVPRGYPILSSRQYEALIDHFVVPSRRLKRTCINLGVPEDKVLVVPNAPVVHPQSLDQALEMAADKSRRPYSPERPVRILFAGRFDDQKGYDRLGPIHKHLRDLGVPFAFTVIGKAVLSRVDPADALPGATILPPAQDPATLARYYADTDIFLLPSRWEGVPLSMLEAMSFGSLVVATNVGAIDEVIEDGVNGFLIDSDSPEEEIVAAISNRIAGIGSQAIACDRIREEAVRTAMSFTWHDAAEHLTALVETTRGSEA
jgi:glycosyltransferase involved in cell wall biosynthesis